MDYSQIFNKYANIGSTGTQNTQGDTSGCRNNFNNTSGVHKFGTASILTNSSISGTQSLDLPLQT